MSAWLLAVGVHVLHYNTFAPDTVDLCKAHTADMVQLGPLLCAVHEASHSSALAAGNTLRVSTNCAAYCLSSSDLMFSAAIVVPAVTDMQQSS